MMAGSNSQRFGDSNGHELLRFGPNKSAGNSSSRFEVRLFLSCDLRDDFQYLEQFIAKYSEQYECVLSSPKTLESPNGLDYLTQLLGSDCLSSDTTHIVFVGDNTAREDHIDWDMAASLSAKQSGVSGLVGIMLPSYFSETTQPSGMRLVPPRLVANVKSGYARVFTWDYIMAESFELETLITDACLRAKMAATKIVTKTALQKTG